LKNSTNHKSGFCRLLCFCKRDALPAQVNTFEFLGVFCRLLFFSVALCEMPSKNTVERWGKLSCYCLLFFDTFFHFFFVWGQILNYYFQEFYPNQALDKKKLVAENRELCSTFSKNSCFLHSLLIKMLDFLMSNFQTK